MNEALTGQWADSLLELEKLRLLKLLVWASISIVTGTAILAILRARRSDSPLLSHFSIQALAWGLVDLALALWGRQGLALRDLAAATALDRFTWFSVGLDVGILAVGITIAIVGYQVPRRDAFVGAGVGVVM